MDTMVDSNSENVDNRIYITMFYKFSFTYHNKTIYSDHIKSDKLVKLLSYLLMHNQNTVPSTELSELLWYYDEIDNPIGALKNLVYRLRTLLKKEFQITDFIITGKSSYAINQAYDITLDVLQFENCNNLIKNKQDVEANYQTIFNLYTGKYLSEIKGDHMILAKAAYYHSIFTGRVIEYAQLLEKDKEYDRMEILARKAIDIDELEEGFYEMLIRSLYLKKQYKKALNVYDHASSLLYSSLGIQPSKALQDLHKIIKNIGVEKNSDINDIQKELIEEEKAKHGAFFCEYGTFKELYAVQSRGIDRLGICSQLCLVTLKDNSRFESDKENNKPLFKKTMNKIKDALTTGLRTGDIVSQLSTNQFIILLTACNYENSVMALDRVLRKIRYSLNQTSFTIDIHIKEVYSGSDPRF